VKLPNILIVDDDIEIAEAVSELLTGAGHATRIARDGAAGLRQVADEAPDLILLDVEMPVLDGPGMARALAAQRAGQHPIPIVLVSAARDVRTIAGSVGALQFLKKPFSRHDLIEVLTRVRLYSHDGSSTTRADGGDE
jgi:two-component system, OmpR family, response regulator PrrA